MLFSYHLGSVAFGALLLATVKFIRALLDYLDKKLSTAQNRVAKFIMLYVVAHTVHATLIVTNYFQMSEVLFLVPGTVSEVPNAKRIHYGNLSFDQYINQ